MTTNNRDDCNNYNYGMNYSPNVNGYQHDITLLHQINSTCKHDSWTETTPIDAIENNIVTYSEREFNQDHSFHLKYFCILSGSFPDIPSVYIDKIYDRDTIELWVWRHLKNDSPSNKKMFRNPLNGNLAMYPKPSSLCCEQSKLYKSNLAVYISRKTNRNKWFSLLDLMINVPFSTKI